MMTVKEVNIHAPDFDRNRALEQQITMLQLKKEHLENLILFARGTQLTGVKNMDFKAFDKSRLDEYAEQARKQWGQTAAWQEFEEKSKGRNDEAEKAAAAGLMLILEDIGKQKRQGLSAKAPEVQALVKRLQNYITEHYYHCTPEILSGLGKMYAGGGDFTVNIDQACGEGTAVFAGEAIAAYCKDEAGKE